MAEKIFKGIGASAGVAVGPAFLFNRMGFSVLRRVLRAEEVDEELERYWRALEATRLQLDGLVLKAKNELGEEHASIFKAHQMVLDDPIFVEEIPQAVRDRRLNVEFLLKEALGRFKSVFENMEDSYFRDRQADVDDVGNRVLKNLLGQGRDHLKELDRPVVIVAENIAPSDTVSLSPQTALGLVVDVGGRTSHVAIVARSLGIPAVVGLSTASLEIQEGDILVVDGGKGLVIQNPLPQTLKKYRAEKEKYEKLRKSLEGGVLAPAVTRDGRRVTVAANLELPVEVEEVAACGAEGVGLFRTEFLFLGRNTPPEEEEQYRHYREVAEKLNGAPLVIRTLDLGGDKYLPQWNPAHETNPFLGLRAIRLSLRKPEMFRTQLRAILRASRFGNVKVMFPMISSVQEFREALGHFEAAQAELRAKKESFAQDIEVGAMVEVPSAAVLADALAKEADFLSLGTNDLIQYTLAVDRVNESVAYLYDPLNPAVLRLIRCVVEACHRFNRWSGLCGEMGGDPRLVPLLVGLGLDEISCSLSVVGQVKRVIQTVSFEEVQKMAREALARETSQEVEVLLREKTPKELQALWA